MKRRFNLNGNLISLIVVGAVFTMLAFTAFLAVDSFNGNAGGKSLKSLEEAVKKAAVQCYAIEGSYPPDIDYLAKHYGIVLNKDAYYYHYEVTGANLMPDIAVIKK